jgi:hypothetical protein
MIKRYSDFYHDSWDSVKPSKFYYKVMKDMYINLTKDELTEHFKILLRTLKLKKIKNGII